jgi:methylmalonyl-CoA mutase
VSDPAAGSGGIEALTQQLCEAGWTLFQEIEKAGGAFAALEQNLIQSRVAATRTMRERDILSRNKVLTGATEFPNLHEARVAVLEAEPIVLPPYGEAKLSFNALSPMRLAVPFERLRDRSDRILKEQGGRPKIFLANLGTPADFTERASFAKSFFEIGGIEAIDTDGFTDAAALAPAFRSSGAALACLCSRDKIYAEHAVIAAQALQAAGAKHIYIAGRPGEHEAAFRSAGVQEFVFAGADVVAVLQELYRLTE